MSSYSSIDTLAESISQINEFLYKGTTHYEQAPNTPYTIKQPSGHIPSLCEKIRTVYGSGSSNLAFYVQQEVRAMLSHMIARRLTHRETDLAHVNVTIHFTNHPSAYGDRHLMLGVTVSNDDIHEMMPIEEFFVELAYRGAYGIYGTRRRY